jgi:hypothetical protein
MSMNHNPYQPPEHDTLLTAVTPCPKSHRAAAIAAGTLALAAGSVAWKSGQFVRNDDFHIFFIALMMTSCLVFPLAAIAWVFSVSVLLRGRHYFVAAVAILLSCWGLRLVALIWLS